MSIKLKIGWANNNVIVEGVRIYKSLSSFNVDSRPSLYAEILDGSDLYEDFNVIEGQTYFYMLSCFLGDLEVFTNCYEVQADIEELWVNTSNLINILHENALLYSSLEYSAARITLSASLSGSTKWAGGVLAKDGKIYCIPYDAADILIIDPLTQTATRSTLGASLSGSSRWYGGVLGLDGKIYSIPHSIADILIIDPATQTATRSTLGASLSSLTAKWRSGVIGSNGKIYCTPSTETTLLIIDPLSDSAITSNLGVSLSGSGKWQGGILADDGDIYFVPYTTTNILALSKNSGVPALSLKALLSPHLNKL